MKIKNTTQIEAFNDAINRCAGDVYLRSPYGDSYNLKSGLSKCIALGKLLRNHGDELELFCMNKADEHYFFEFFAEYPEVLE